MSYILDALKRSEQERHQDKMPSFSAESMILQTNQKKTHWWPYALISVLILNALVLFFFYRETPKSTQAQFESEEVELQNINEAKETVISEDVRAKDTYANEISANIPKRAPPPSVIKERQYIQPIKQVSHEKSVSNLPSSTNNESRSNDHLYGTTVEEGLLIQPKSKTLQRELNVTSQDTENARIEPPIQINPTFAQTQSDAGSNNSAEQSEQNSSNNTDAFTDIPLLASLSLSFQKSIPALAFNSHIYSDKRSQRRVMINNYYLKEGQSFDGLELIEIGELFIRVSKNNTVFKLPVLRDWAKK
jgi:general secretion pathway protein B